MAAKTLPDASQAILLPLPTKIKGRMYFSRHAIEVYKARIIAVAVGGEPVMPEVPAVDSLVPAPQLAQELGIHRRTVSRRVVDASRAA
jgi:hypothetical protein